MSPEDGLRWLLKWLFRTGRWQPIAAVRPILESGQGPGPCVAERDEFRAQATGEMVEVDAAIHPAVGSSDSGAHGVYAIYAISIRVHNLPGEGNEFHIIGRQVLAWYVHAHHFRAGASLTRDHAAKRAQRAAPRAYRTGKGFRRPGVAPKMSKSSSRRFPVTVTHLPVTRCQVCRQTVAYRPGSLSEVLTEHYRRAHPEALGPPAR